LGDGVAKYDPNAASNAFSLIGLSGTTAGGGDTQDRRLDDSLKYSAAIGPVHVGGLYKFSQSFGAANTAEQFNIGFEYVGLSVDAYYSHVRDAVSASAMTAAQEAIAVAAPYFLSTSNSVAGTISDNQSVSLFALYNLGFVPVKVYAGYEHIQFGNPKNPLAIGFDDIGGYKLGAVNDTAFPHEKVLQVYWAGVKYTALKQLDLTAAYYGIHQNSYGVGKGIAGCSTIVAGTCTGTELVVSVDADYRWTKRFDTYAGIMYSSVSDGLANGYLKTTNANPTIGFRFRF
jgi:predicted porin